MPAVSAPWRHHHDLADRRLKRPRDLGPYWGILVAMPTADYRRITTVDGLQEYIAALEAEIASASCGPCRARKLGGYIRGAKRQIVFVRREEAKAAAKAAAAGEAP